MEGVKSVEPNPVAQTTEIVFDDAKISINTIIAELRKERYVVLGEPKYIK
jgi:copper chaperone CopZ